MTSKIRPKTYKSKGKKARKTTMATKAYVKRVINTNIETKVFYIDSGGTSLPFSKLGNLISLSDVTNGTLNTQRIGDIIHPTKISIRLRVTCSATPPDIARVIVFIWKPDSTPGIGDVLQSGVGLDYQSAMSAYNDDNDLYQILYDSYFGFSSPPNDIRAFSITKKLKLKQDYTGRTATSSTKKIYMILLGEGTPTNSYVFNSVMYFKDG